MNTIKEAWLTIDDCPSADFAAKLAYLSQEKIPALLFCEGWKLLERAELIIEAIKKGFVIGNHSYDHPFFSELSLAACRSSIQRTDAIINDLYGRAGINRPGRYFRFPYFDRGGRKNPEQQRALQDYLAELGYAQPDFPGINLKHFQDSGDAGLRDVSCTFNQEEYWLGNPDAPDGLNEPKSILALIDKDEPEAGFALNCVSTRDIILTHDHEFTTQLFFEIIQRYQKKGIQFLPIHARSV